MNGWHGYACTQLHAPHVVFEIALEHSVSPNFSLLCPNFALGGYMHGTFIYYVAMHMHYDKNTTVDI